MSVHSWEATNENVKVFCVSARTPAEAFARLTLFCAQEKIDHVSALTVTYWDEDGRYFFNLYY